ncbi:MAG: phospholipase [Bacteroidia bacterium]|nr:phospholipase [Bacteroidia bacterium]
MSIDAILVITIVSVAVVLALVLWRMHYKGLITHEEDPSLPKAVDKNIECCGEHDVCEAETLLTLTDDIIYYSDEELDAYRGREEDQYTDSEIEEFRDVLLTLQPHEVSGWLKSIQLRRIEMPYQVKEEALMMVEEFRWARRENRNNKATDQL